MVSFRCLIFPTAKRNYLHVNRALMFLLLLLLYPMFFLLDNQRKKHQKMPAKEFLASIFNFSILNKYTYIQTNIHLQEFLFGSKSWAINSLHIAGLDAQVPLSLHSLLANATRFSFLKEKI